MALFQFQALEVPMSLSGSTLLLMKHIKPEILPLIIQFHLNYLPWQVKLEISLKTAKAYLAPQLASPSI
jgi:hypothetical protein